MSSVRKLFVGPRVRRLREAQGWSQGALAQRLALSLSYVSQIENNQRPVTAGVLLKLAEAFGGDVAQFSEEQDKRQLAELDSALHDRGLRAEPLPPAALARLVEQAPELVDAFLTLYQRHSRLQEEHAQTVDRFYGELGADLGDGRLREAQVPLPHEEVRDHFNRRNNYLDALDRAAEALADELALSPGQRAVALQAALRERCGVAVAGAADEAPHAAPGSTRWLRRYDPLRKRLSLASGLSDAQQAFQIATQWALLVQADALEAQLHEGGFADAASQALARQGFAHYFAGAVLLPYGPFLEAARRCRYDVELLQQLFHVSFETVCHRLSTLQRPGARGVPFYFVRLDQAGNISKRQSATAFHFARHGGACPLWHVHEAFAQPGRILTQVAEMPDGTRFFGIARTIERGGGGFKASRKLFAIGLGCELSHAPALVYADGIATEAPRDVMPIGPGCRVCPRADCVQRAFPPAGKALVADSDAESLVSYRFEAG
ncbi:helix-turn-helix domain-containing protein [Aquabacterium sp.]|uniref:helix-turn-helix domain-containing protein n=1 Tax=Aquabacterium sp. TaxID=1872578 RepID=UPI002B68DC7B|nr:short-chain fatty acyl-CoA regulator family protein [Aquabacterium sp.]HSW06562.1 short-chain fatty acyl-CoA regulator family protein [Aquabacterium sp.]